MASQKKNKCTHEDFFQNEHVKRLMAELDAGRRNKRLLYQNEAPLTKFYKTFCDSFKAVTGQTEEYLLNVIQTEYENVYVFIDRKLSGPQAYIAVLDSAMLYVIIKYFPDKLEPFLLTAYPGIYQEKTDFLEKGMALYQSIYKAVGRTFVSQDTFWSIAPLSGGSIVITEGKTGTLGQSTRLHFGDETKANKEIEKNIAAKLKKGYVEEASNTGKPVSSDSSLKLIPFRRGDKWGYCTPDKTIAIPCIYDDARPFAHGMAEVMCSTVISEAKGKTPAVEKHEYNFIDVTGRELLPEPVLATWPATDGLAFFRRFDKTCGFVNAKGEIVADGFANGEPFSEGLAAMVRQDGKSCYIDTTGKEVFLAPFDRTAPFKEGRAYVSKNGQYGFIDTTGNLIVPCIYKNVGPFSEGLAVVEDVNYRKGYIDTMGNVIIPLEYRDATAFSEGLAAVQRKDKDDKYGYIDRQGNTAIPFQYGKAMPFSNGLAVVAPDPWSAGFCIDKQGVQKSRKWRFGNPFLFSDGLTRVTSDLKRWGFISVNDELIIPEKYESTGNFENGLCSVSWPEKKVTYQGYIDTAGNEYWENIAAAPVKKATPEPKKPADIRCDNYQQYTDEIDAQKAEEKYHISEYICYPFLDTAEDQDTRIHKGNLHLNSLTVTDGFNLIVDGNLTVNDDIEWREWGRGAFLFVTGNLVVRNLFLAGCPAVAILGNLTAKNGIVGSQGDNGGELIVRGKTKAKIIYNTSYFNMDFSERPDAFIIADARDSALKVDVDEFDAKAIAKALVPACCPEEEGMIGLDALKEMLSQGKKVLK